MEGIVKNWMDGRGYGFIEVENSDEDVFVHYSELKGTYALRRDQKVEFEVESTYKGPRAVDVKIMG